MEILHQASFVLRKWATNTMPFSPAFLLSFGKQSLLEIDRSPAINTLGLLWLPQSDTFQFKIPAVPLLDVATKRLVVSEISIPMIVGRSAWYIVADQC